MMFAGDGRKLGLYQSCRQAGFRSLMIYD